MVLQPWKDVGNVDPLKELTVRMKAAFVLRLENAVKQNKGINAWHFVLTQNFTIHNRTAFKTNFLRGKVSIRYLTLCSQLDPVSNLKMNKINYRNLLFCE